VTRSVQVRPGAYQDSVSLMLVSRELQGREGVSSALVAMATGLNLDLLAQMGFDAPDGASPNDMLVAIDADDEATVDEAVAALDAALVRRPASGGESSGDTAPPSTIQAAARRTDATLALISTPGSVAAVDAADAIAAGLDVMVFSDNVSVEQEVALKSLAADAGVLMMGPDCGTAVVGGVGLGFANVVRPGPVGIVAASGTGAQHLLALLDGAGIGVQHCLGVGGRDLSSAVGGRSTIAALDALEADDDVSTIVMISKPPAPEVAAVVTAHAESLATPVVVGYLSPEQPDITVTAAALARRLGLEWREPARWGADPPPPRPGFVRGLYSGGTLCDEAMLLAVEQVSTVASNIALAGQPTLPPGLESQGHTFIDFGDDALTVGRAHPMIDPTLRLQRLRTELADPECAVVLLDVVLGHGSHPDPATEIAAAIKGSDTPVVVSLVGTRDDPQGLEETARRLAAAGAIVHASNSAATREALSLIIPARVDGEDSP
jgi:FdrA protein